MKSYFVFGEKNSREFGITVEYCPPFGSGQRSVEKQTVPGRNGDLLIDTGTFSNYIQQYEIWFKDKKPTIQAARAIAIWLMAQTGYVRLEDSYDSDIYRMACFSGPLDVTNWMLKRGRATLEFDCKPQRYLKQGEFPIVAESGKTLGNQWMPALPLIQIEGTGNGLLSVGESQVNITGMTGSITLDCEVQNAYDGTENLNNSITITGGWPVLVTGQTAISFSGGISGVKIIPRWWSL